MDKKVLQNLAISETGFIFDPVTGNSYNSNETGVFIINTLKDGKSVEELITLMASEYDVEEKDIEKDIQFFITQLETHLSL